MDNQGKPPLDTEVFGDVDAQDLKAWNYETEGVIVSLTDQNDRRPSSPTLDKAKPRKMSKDRIYSRAMRGDACLKRMRSEGVVFRRAQNCLCIGNHLLRWPDRCIPRKSRHQESLRRFASGLITKMTAPFTQKPGAREVSRACKFLLSK